MTPDPRHYLTNDDVAAIKQWIAETRDQPSMPRRGSEATVEREETFVPETYLARTPTGGIAALVENTTGTGTTDETDDVIYSALCDVYRLDPIGVSTPGTGRLTKLRFQKRVWNIAPVALPERQLVLITRDKFGRWYATAPWLDFGTC